MTPDDASEGASSMRSPQASHGLVPKQRGTLVGATPRVERARRVEAARDWDPWFHVSSNVSPPRRLHLGRR